MIRCNSVRHQRQSPVGVEITGLHYPTNSNYNKILVIVISPVKGNLKILAQNELFIKMKKMYQLNQIPSEAQIRKHLKKIVFGSNIHCPICSTRKITVGHQRYWCTRCRRKFSLLSHTWLSHLKLPLQTFWLILWCWTQQIPVKQTSKLSSLSQTTIYHWFDVFRSKLPQDQDLLESLVQLDEAYFGGRGKETMRALFMGKQIDSRKLAYRIQTTYPVREDAWDFLRANIAPKTQIATDVEQ